MTDKKPEHNCDDDYLENHLYHPYHDPNVLKRHSWWDRDRHHGGYRPWYDNQADYNTNAKSYYDYLGYRARLLDTLIEFCNQLFDRDLQVEDTDSVDLTKVGDWHTDDDVIKLLANVRIDDSDTNAIKVKPGGLFVYDWGDTINEILDRLSELENRVDELERQLASSNNAIEKIINRLQEQGAWQGGLNGDFVPGQSVASGNINVFGNDYDHYIKTHNDPARDGDMIQGVD